MQFIQTTSSETAAIMCGQLHYMLVSTVELKGLEVHQPIFGIGKKYDFTVLIGHEVPPIQTLIRIITPLLNTIFDDKLYCSSFLVNLNMLPT